MDVVCGDSLATVWSGVNICTTVSAVPARQGAVQWQSHLSVIDSHASTKEEYDMCVRWLIEVSHTVECINMSVCSICRSYSLAGLEYSFRLDAALSVFFSVGDTVVDDR